MRKICILLLLGLTLIGCQLSPAQPTIFDSSICKAPCWQGVTPGVTSKEDALAIFTKYSAFGDHVDIMPDHPQDGFDDDIRFSPYVDGITSVKGQATVFARTLDDRVSLMKFEGNFGVTIERAIELFGEPESVLVIHTGLFDKITLLNPTKGIAFGWLLTRGPNLDAAEISPEVEIGQIYFFDSGQYERFLNAPYLAGGTLNGNEIRKNLHLWKGYGSFKEKYWPPATKSPP